MVSSKLTPLIIKSNSLSSGPNSKDHVCDLTLYPPKPHPIHLHPHTSTHPQPSLPPSHTFILPLPSSPSHSLLLIPPQTQQKILASAFLRSLKDPFPPARCAGIRAMADTHSYYLTSDIATRLLPSLCTMTVDGDKTVRDEVSL